ncbi:MAG: hypothetical protein WC831_02425 [Parcubacteria group bacterium]|jgi:hypothetical protein
MIKRFFDKIIIIILILEISWFIFIYSHNSTLIQDILKNIKTDAWTAIGTIFLGMVALLTFFYDRYKNRRAKVSMLINTVPPDCHQIELTNSKTGEFISQSIYIRIRVEHIGGNSAEDAEIMVSNFWIVNDHGGKIVKKAFLPMNLTWSHFGGKKRSVPRGLFRYCDFGRFQPKYTNNTHTILRLDTAVQPNRVSDGEIPNVIEPGKYEFELILSGVNSNFIRKRWILEFKKNWSDDESEMLNEHIIIKERKWYNFFANI